MENAKRKRGRPPKRKAMELEGMTYEGAINNALDKEIAAELDDTLAHKSEDELTDDERKYEEEWEYERECLRNHRPLAWVYNIDDETGEIGTIHYKMFAGGPGRLG